MAPVISLSTCWNSPRHTDGYEMMSEIAALGFRRAELSHGVRLALVPGILRALEEGLIEVSSTHNFCPLPPGMIAAAPNLFRPTSKDPKKLAQWERYTRRSLDFARQVGAKAVVTHLGDVGFGWMSPTAGVNALMHRGRADEKTVARIRPMAARCVEKVQRRKDPYWDRVHEGLRRILPMARECGLVIGAENREKVDELPLDSDFTSLLNHFRADSGLAYWHDAGHAHLKEKLGLISHEEHLAAHAKRLAGVHLHDVRGFTDHLPPGRGEIDFRMITRHVRPEHIVVLELNPRLSPSEVVAGREHLERIFAEG